MTDQVNTTAYKTIYTQHAGLIKDYLSALATDPNFYENEDLYSAGDNLFEAQKYWLYYLSGSDSAGKAGLIGYFDQRAETAEDLDHISTTQELAQLLYRYQPGDYIYDYSEAQGYHLIDTVLGETPGVTEGGHLSFIRLRMDPGLATQVDVTLSQAEVRIKDRIWLAEHHLYGSSRLGMRRYPSGAFYNSWDYTGETPEIDTNLQVKQPWYSAEYNDVIQAGYGDPYGHVQTATFKTQHTLGAKGYELSNHLGNVQVVVTDKKFEQDLDDDDTIDVYAPSLTAAYDYYPFGMLMPGRYVRDTTKLGWRNGFGNHERINEYSGLGNTVDMGDRWLEVRLGRTHKPDIHENKYPSLSPYSYVLNNPIILIDPDGKDVLLSFKKTKKAQGNTHIKAVATINLTIVDPAGQLTGTDRTKINDYGKTFGTNGIKNVDANGKVMTMDLETKINLRVVKSINQAKSTDFILHVADKIPGEAVGKAQLNGDVGAVENKYIGEEFSNIAMHELGHILGFEHRGNTLMKEELDKNPDKNKYNVSDVDKKNIWKSLMGLTEGKEEGAVRTFGTPKDSREEIKNFNKKLNITVPE